MLKTLLLITSLQTGSVDIMSFDNPVNCYNYVQNNQNQDRYTLECVPAGDHVVNAVTQNFYSISRVINILGKL